MTDKKDDIGKGAQKAGDQPRRPYATLDLQATEIGAKDDAPKANSADSQAGDEDKNAPPGNLAPPDSWSQALLGNNAFLSHVAAGVAGGVLAVAAASLFGIANTSGDATSTDIDKRLTGIEQTVQRQAAAQSSEISSKLAKAEGRLKGLEDQTRTLSALNDAQAKLAANLKALETRNSSADYTGRLSKLETSLAALAANDKSGQASALADKLTALEKQVGEASSAVKAATERTERDLNLVKTETGALARRLEGLKTETEQRFKTAATDADVAGVTRKLETFERSLQGFLKGEGERTSNAVRVLLALEIANLKRAMDRGGSYATELDAVRKLSGTMLDLTPLERYSRDGAPTTATLAKDFRQVANKALDAEAESSDASVIDRLLSGARSIVRVRKIGHSAEDTSTEAVLGRMEAAVKEGRLGEVLEQAKKLPPKAALVSEDWLKQVEARYTVDRALSNVETALKSSLAAGNTTPPEPKR